LAYRCGISIAVKVHAMNRKVLGLLTVLLLALAYLAEAQQAKKIHRMGYLVNGDAASESTRSEAIRQGLRELGTSKDKTSPPSTDMRREARSVP